MTHVERSHVQIPMLEKIYEILNGDSWIQANTVGVYNNVPENEDYPYIRMGLPSFNDRSSHTTDGFSGDVNIHCFSQARSELEARQILDRIYELLHVRDLELEDFQTLNFRCSLSEVIMDPDNRTHHGIQTYSFLFGGNETQ